MFRWRNGTETDRGYSKVFGGTDVFTILSTPAFVVSKHTFPCVDQYDDSQIMPDGHILTSFSNVWQNQTVFHPNP